jgi:chaperonin GroES
VAKGNQVLFSSYSGTEIKVEGEDLLILDEGDILAILG